MLSSLDRAVEVQENVEPAVSTEKQTLMSVLASTLRPCDVKLVVRTEVARDAALAVARAFVFAADLPRVMGMLGSRTFDDILAAISSVASLLGPRYAILFIKKMSDGSIGACRLLSGQGTWTVPTESIVRYVLFPWTTPLVLEGESLSEIKIHATVREALRLRAPDATSMPPSASAAAPAPNEPAVPDSLSSVLAHLQSLVPEVRAATEAMKNVTVPPPPIPLVTAQPVASLEPPDSAVTRAMKRTISYLEANA
jgi:hypothetical protein